MDAKLGQTDLPVPTSSLTRDAVVYGVGGSIAQVAYVLFIPVFTRIFSPSEFGVLDFLLTLTAISALIAQAGLNSALFFYYRADADLAKRRQLAATALAFVGAAGSAIALAGVLIAPSLSGWLIGTGSYGLAMALAFAWIPVTLVGNLALDVLRLEFRPVAYSVVSVLRTLIGTTTGAILAGPLGWGVAGMLAAYVLIGVLAAVVALWLARASLTSDVRVRAAGRLLRFGLPLIPVGLAYWIIGYSDRYLLIQIAGTADAGIYSLSNRVASGMLLIIYAFEAAWWPFAFARAREPDHREEFARTFAGYSAVLLAVATVIGLFAREFLMLMTTRDFVGAYPFVGILGVALAIHGIYAVISLAVQLGNGTKHMAWTSGVGASANIALNIVLIPPLGILGACIATLAAYGLSTALLYVLAQRLYPVPYPTIRVLLGLAICAAVLVAGLQLDAGAGVEWSPMVIGIKAALWFGSAVILFVLLRRDIALPSVRLMRNTHP